MPVASFRGSMLGSPIVTIQVSLLLDSSLPTAVHPGREWVWAVPPQAAQPTPTPYLGEPPQAASSPE